MSLRYLRVSEQVHSHQSAPALLCACGLGCSCSCHLLPWDPLPPPRPPSQEQSSEPWPCPPRLAQVVLFVLLSDTFITTALKPLSPHLRIQHITDIRILFNSLPTGVFACMNICAPSTCSALEGQKRVRPPPRTSATDSSELAPCGGQVWSFDLLEDPHVL